MGSETRKESLIASVADTSGDVYQRLVDLWSRTGREKIRGITETRRPYGFVRNYYRRNPEKFGSLRKRLNQARIAVPYDVYLTRATHVSVLMTLVAVFVGAAATVVLSSLGYLEGVRSPVRFQGGLAVAVESYALLFQTVIVALVLGLLVGVVTYALYYYYPWVRANQRRQNINILLPHAVTYMYALSHGGVGILEVMSRLADSEDMYGEVANEFEGIVRDMEAFGTELPQAVNNARQRTPSDNMKTFLDDMLGVMDSGGDLTVFLRNESERYLDSARNEQRDFIDTVGLLSEIYITLFIAGPLLFIIILLVMSFMGGSTVGAIQSIIYGLIPIGLLLFGVVLWVISKPYFWTTGDISSDLDERRLFSDPPTAEDVRDDPRFTAYRRGKRTKRLVGFLSDPLKPLREKPALSLVVTVPASVVVVWTAASANLVPTDMGADPVGTTTALVVLPFLIAVLPWSVFHEYRSLRKSRIIRSLPDKLNAVSNANNMGLSLTDALRQVSARSTGGLGKEMRMIRNDINWNFVTSNALIDSANRIRIPQVTRNLNLVAEASRSTGNLNKILEVAADDTWNEFSLRRERYREMSGYVAVVMVSFFVYLGIVLLLDLFYLTPLSRAIEQAGAIDVNLPDSPLASFNQTPISTYKMLFYHSTLIQALGSGLLAGMLGDDSPKSGLKYSIALILLTVFAFTILT